MIFEQEYWLFLVLTGAGWPMDLNWDISADSRLANFPNYMSWFLIIFDSQENPYIFSKKKKKKKSHILEETARCLSYICSLSPL